MEAPEAGGLDAGALASSEGTAETPELSEQGAQVEVSPGQRALRLCGWATLLVGILTLVVSRTLLVEGHTALDAEGKPNPAFHDYLARARYRDGCGVLLLLLGTAALGVAKLQQPRAGSVPEDRPSA